MNKNKIAKQTKKVQIPKEKIIEIAILKLLEPGCSDFESARIVSDYLFFDIAKSIIDKNIKYLEENTIEFLEAITKYLLGKNSSLIEQNEISTHKLIIKETKIYIKHIRKSLRKIEKNFNETYLLYKRDNKFYINDNIRLLTCLEELSQALSLTNYHSESEKCFNIKSKIELGIRRYFIQKKTILKSFDENGNFEVSDNSTSMQVYQYSNQKPNLEMPSTNNFTQILNFMQYLKKYNAKEFENLISKYVNIIEFFPQFIYNREEYLEISSISKSINRNFSENTMDLIKQKIIIKNPYHTKTINKVLELLK